LVLQEKEVLTETSLGAIRIFSKEIAWNMEAGPVRRCRGGVIRKPGQQM
jgi:hypothetical protein